MNLIAFNFKKISIERFESSAKEVKVNNNIKLDKIEQTKADLIKTRDELLTADFTYVIDYDPDYAKIEFKGTMVVAVDPKIAKETLKEWKSNKIQEDFRVFVFNVILKKSNIKALELEDEMNLLPHLPLPTIRKEEKKE